MLKNCIICGNEFETVKKNKVCCSHECRMKTPCIQCGRTDRCKNEECKFCKKAYNKKRYWKDPEKMREDKKEYYENNKEEFNKKVAEWQANNPKLVKKYKRKWKMNNHEKRKLYNDKRNQIKAELPQEVYDFDLICKFYKNKCVRCYSTNNLTIDHVIPISWKECPGDIPLNIQPLCLSCNSSKRNSNCIDYRWDKGIEMLKYLENNK